MTVLAGLTLPAVVMFAQPASAAAEAVSLSQCTNGGAGPPLVLDPCLNGTLASTSYADWMNGNANSSKSHWKEGQFIAYRADMTGLGAGSHTYTIDYHTVDTSKHAIDYLGSYDATETTSPTASAENRNDSNPCFDILGSAAASGCTAPGTAPAPAATTPVPAANLAAEKTCNGAAGLPTTPTEVAGTFDLFAPTAAGASMTSSGASYVSQNVTQGGGVCDTTIAITFNLSGTPPSGGWEVVLAWGGHIASALDWGDGNSASAISGSPYHMMQDSIDTTGLGSQDRALMANAVAGPPTVATQVSKTSIGVGGSLTDTATLAGSAGTVTGSVQFQLCSNTTTGCPQATGTNIGSPVNLVNGSATSPSFGSNLAPGNYCIGLVYVNDGASFYSSTYSGSATNECFTVGKGTSNASTTVFDAATNKAWSGTEPTGSSAYDTATVTGSGGFTPSGTVTYTFFTNNSCQGTGTGAGTVTLDAGGNVPNSGTQGPLAAGNYSFQAAYSGDANYAGSISPCEPFSVGEISTTTSTTVFDAATNAAWTGTEQTGASAYDTATVGGEQGNIVPTGTVSYTFFPNGTCAAGTGSPAGTVTLNADGSVPNSGTQHTLAAGAYSFQATYSGDANYSGSTSPCEPFSVGGGSSTTATTVFDASTNAPWAGTETTGSSAYDTATVTSSDTITATGTVSYTFFSNGSCQGNGTGAGTVTLDAAGNVPNSSTEHTLAAGSYSFQATYSGDANYSGSTSDCEPFTVGAGTSTIATTVTDAATNVPWSGTETTGASAYDTATVTSSDTVTATGTVSYTFFTNGTCNGTGTGAGTVTLDAAGNVPNSNTKGPLAAGSYSFQAAYSGDANYSGSTSPCEPFSVGHATSTTATQVRGASSGQPWSGKETVGASAFDSATVSVTGGATPTGTVSYTFFTNGTCSGTGAPAGTVTLDAAGNVPNSNTEGPLAAGSYSFQAAYSGDANYTGSTSPCEPFSVGQGNATTGTVVFDATTNKPWAGTESPGASAYDTATVSGAAGFTPTGTVSYTFFTNGSCSGTGAPAGTVTLSGGKVPSSNTESSLAGGSYSFQATYSGDANYLGSTSSCEPFKVVVAVVSQITPTQTTCAEFASGTAGTQAAVTYATKGTTISSTAPGVFFYWVKVTVTTTGTQTFDITQSTTYSPTTGTALFAEASGSHAYNASCGSLTTTISGTNADRKVVFKAAKAGTYYIGIKYTTSAIVGSGPAATKFVSPHNYLYTFSTTGVAGSTSTLALNHK